MKLKRILPKITLIIALILSLVACSSKPEIKELPKSADAKQEISNLEMTIENSRMAGYDLLAPNSFKEANNSLKKARALEKDGKKNEKVLKEVALGNAYFDRAQETAELNKFKLQDILVTRQAAIDANARTFNPGWLSKLDKKLKEETTKLEKDDDHKLKEKRSELVNGYSNLELESIKGSYLGKSKSIIDESVKNGAPTLAPKTLSVTSKKYNEADAYINQNRHDTSQIELLSAGVLAEARNLEKTTATSQRLSAATPEDTALKMRADQERLSKTQDELNEEKGAAQTLAAKNAELSEEQKLNDVYEEARKKFSNEEAEVYKQGTNLVIRLRSLEFPKSQAVLKGEDFALLRKVEDVIESFDSSNVIVEGHTDSTGDQKLNQELSEKRADTVREYLEVNTAGKVSEFETIGSGYNKPLASNKTEAGRAQNRRVDVIIDPVQI